MYKEKEEFKKAIQTIRDFLGNIEWEMGFNDTIEIDGDVYSKQTIETLADMAEKLDKFINYV